MVAPQLIDAAQKNATQNVRIDFVGIMTESFLVTVRADITYPFKCPIGAPVDGADTADTKHVPARVCDALASLVAQQDQFQERALSPAQASVMRVLYDLIHKHPYSPGFMISDLTAAANADLASCGESAGLNERKLGSILTSLSFTERSRKNTGYFLCLERSDRVRIHATARHYAVTGYPVPFCTLCVESGEPSPTTAAPEAQW